MSYVETAKSRAAGLAGRVAEMLPHRATAQTVTIACPVEPVARFWRDPAQLSMVLGDVASVDADGQDRYLWHLLQGPAVVWESELVEEPDGLRFVGVGDGSEFSVSYRPAPHDLGTEVTLRVKTPVPGLLTGAAAYQVLYRLRALLQTGEIPTIVSNPSARRSAR